jgi:tetratricopeptide (TPR) repeat protein
MNTNVTHSLKKTTIQGDSGMRISAINRLYMVCVLLIFLAETSLPLQASADNWDGEISLHTPAEIVELVETSSVVYEIGILATPLEREDEPVLAPQLYVKTTPDGAEIAHYVLSAAAAVALERGEEAFQEKQYGDALAQYRIVQQLEPEYASLLTLIGDVLYVQRKYARAIEYFEQAIARNFIDYQAHWFLADAQWAQGATEIALHHLTIAHVLNINHPQLRQRLMAYREQAGTPWKSWEFSPQYTLTKQQERVQVRSTEEWLGYALVKALWAYEPGYAEAMGEPDCGQQVVCMLAEKEALVSLLTQHDGTDLFHHLHPIIQDRFVQELIWYELIAPKVPEALLLLPNESLMRIVEYVKRYH